MGLFNRDEYYDPEDFEEGPREKQPKCNRCGLSPLAWHHTGVRWHLMESNGRLHRCSGEVPRSAAMFDPI